jgi:hypothetical protein
MKTIVVKTQKQLDRLPSRFKEETAIEIRSTSRIVLRKVLKNSIVRVYGISEITLDCENLIISAYDNSMVIAYYNSRVYAYDDCIVMAYKNSSVVARNRSMVEANDESDVLAYNHSHINAFSRSCVHAFGESSVVGHNYSVVHARDNSGVETYHHSHVAACGHSRVTANDDSTVIAFDNSRVKAFSQSKVEACSSSTVEMFSSSFLTVSSRDVKVKKLLDYSTCVFKDTKQTSILEKSETATVREVPSEAIIRYAIPFEEHLRRGFVYADGIIKPLVSQKKIGEVEIFEVGDRSKNSFVVKKGNLFSHGVTVEKAIEDLRYKISDRSKSEFEKWRNLDLPLTLDEAIQGYRVITGACELGVKQFVSSAKMPEQLTPRIVLELTKESYGNSELEEFLND